MTSPPSATDLELHCLRGYIIVRMIKAIGHSPGKKMMHNSLQKEIQNILNKYSIQEISSCPIEKLEHEDTTKRIKDILPGVKTILVLMKTMPGSMIDRAHDADYQKMVLKTFQDLNAVSQEIVSCLERFGYKAAWPGSQKTPFQKNIAEKAGLGAISDSKLLVSFQHGIGVQLETVLVDGLLEFDQNESMLFKCDSCGLCIDACPVQAISPAGVNREACVTYRRGIVKDATGIVYCGLCMKACPQKKET
jgi:epoxyqueuosine reductase QueG